MIVRKIYIVKLTLTNLFYMYFKIRNSNLPNFRLLILIHPWSWNLVIEKLNFKYKTIFSNA